MNYYLKHQAAYTISDFDPDSLAATIITETLTVKQTVITTAVVNTVTIVTSTVTTSD